MILNTSQSGKGNRKIKAHKLGVLESNGKNNNVTLNTSLTGNKRKLFLIHPKYAMN